MAEKTGLLFRSVPDNGKVKMTVNQDGFPGPVWPNNTVLTPEIISGLQQRANRLWFPNNKTIDFPRVDWIVNFCADADEYALGLNALDNMVDSKPIPVFNHPRAIAVTRRDIVSRLLDGIPNLTVPKCVRFSPEHPDCFKKAFKENSFDYPVLVRPETSQTGRHLLKIDDDSQWDKIFQIPWGGQGIYMTQFVDFRNEAGGYMKLRIVFVNGRAHFRSCFPGDDWLRHGDNRTEESVDFELKFKDEIENSPVVQEMADEVWKRIPLDFWGLDVGQVSGDQYVMFEANAAMTIADTSHTKPELVEKMRPIYAPIFSGLNQSVRNPDTWRQDARTLPSVQESIPDKLKIFSTAKSG